MQLLREGGVDWDDRFRLIYDGELDEDSNVTDLLSDLTSYKTRDSTPPRGYRRFYEELRKLNIPEQIVGNPYRTSSLQRSSASDEELSSDEEDGTGGNRSMFNDSLLGGTRGSPERPTR